MESLLTGDVFMSTLDDFRRVAAVLEKFVSKPGVTISLDKVARDLNLHPNETKAICERLAHIGILANTPDFEHWALAVAPGEVTLEDVWRTNGGINDGCTTIPSDDDAPSKNKVDLIITQAFLGIHHSIAAQLRRYRLDCIQVSQQQFQYVANNSLAKRTSAA